MSRIKGPVFPSFRDQQTAKPKMQWRTGLQSRRQQCRNLRAKCRWILDSKDPNVIYAGLLVMDAVKEEPDPEFSSLHLMCAGMDLAEQTESPWPETMVTIIARFKALEEAERGKDEKPKRVESRPRLSRRIGAFFARTLRSRHEATPEGDEHQRPRVADCEQTTGGRGPEEDHGASGANH